MQTIYTNMNEWMKWKDETEKSASTQKKFLEIFKDSKKNIENLLYLYAGVNDKIFEKREFFDTI